MDQVWLVLLLQLPFLKPISIRRKCPSCIRYRQFEQKTIEQCPCVKPPGSNECLSYDNRLQAANIDEALHTFPDLSSMAENALPLVPDESNIMMKSFSEFSLSQKTTYKTPKMYKCDGKECQSCKLLIINAFLRASDNDFPTDSSTVTELPSDTDESLCMKNRSIPRNAINEGIENATIIKELPTHMEEFIMLGVPITINCNYKKGEEIVQGFGNCRPVMRNINVLRNAGTHKSPRWVQESINTISACECQVEIGTPLHSLVLR
uniref:Protein spaetzle n=1 Tax=Loa loa TaxID=7209 RepID=A0A1I7VQD6_LOALO